MGKIPGCEGALVKDVEEWMDQDKESELASDWEIVAALKSKDEIEKDSTDEEEVTQQKLTTMKVWSLLMEPFNTYGNQEHLLCILFSFDGFVTKRTAKKPMWITIKMNRYF